MASDPRTFKLQASHMHGDDVRDFQRVLQTRFDAWTIHQLVSDDGDYGAETKEAAQRVCIGLGILHEVAMRNGVTPELRVKIHDPERRDDAEKQRADGDEAKTYRAKLRKRFADAGRVIDGHPVAPWIIPSLQWARENGWKGQVVSGYRTCAHQTEVAAEYARSKGLTLAQAYPHGPCASNHVGLEFPRGAVDVTDYEQLNEVLKHNPHKPGLVWAGPIIGDVVHFSAHGN